jgi:hypothetical protein
VESDLVIQQVGSRLAGNGGGPLVSLHDTLYCRQDDLPVVDAAFQQQFKAMGLSLQLKVA